MGRKHDETLGLVREAIEQLRRSDNAEALTTLERCAFPKWHSVEDSQIDYLLAVTPDANEATVVGQVYGEAMLKEAAGELAVATHG